MEAYKKQMCEDEEPVLRVYGTKLFKQEIEYVVLVHSPQFNEKFSRYPLLASSPLVSYEGNQIISFMCGISLASSFTSIRVRSLPSLKESLKHISAVVEPIQ